MPTTSPLIGSLKAAALLGVDRSVFNKLVAAGKLKPLAVGEGRTGARFFSPSDVLKLKGKRERGEK